MIQNIIFDIGQVLVEFNARGYMKKWFPDGQTAEHVYQATVGNPIWMEIDRGSLSMEELIRKCCALDPEYETEIRLFFERKNVIAQEYPYAAGWIRELKQKGYGVYLLSNYSEAAFGYLQQRARFLKEVDGMMISYQIKAVKPEPEIYQALLLKYQLNGDECVFLDDVPANLAGAEIFGMKTVLFTCYEQGRAELEQILQK